MVLACFTVLSRTWRLCTRPSRCVDECHTCYGSLDSKRWRLGNGICGKRLSRSCRRHHSERGLSHLHPTM